MAAPIMDKLIPSAVFIIALMSILIMISGLMTPTINANQRSELEAGELYGNPDYLTTMYENGTYVTWDPNPLHVNETMAIDDWYGESDLSKTATFSSDYPNEKKDIAFWAVKNHWYSLSSDDLHQLRFLQFGGWLGAEKYRQTVNPDDWLLDFNNSESPYWYAMLELRHTYLLTLAPTYGNDTWTSFYNWSFDLRIEHLINGTQKADPWIVVMQLFGFNLPGVPQFISVMLMVPIYVTIALVTYALVRSIFPF